MSVTAVILAAGSSTRMGEANKLLLDVGGVPIIRRVADAVIAVCDQSPVVVLGPDPVPVSQALGDLDLLLLQNPTPEAGQAASVELGLSGVADAETTLVVPGDQPFMTEDLLRALIRAHTAGPEGCITVPMRGEDRGNPIALPRKRRDEILASGKNTGCRAFTRDNPHLINRYETADRAFYFDVDTPEDLANAKAAFLAEEER